jgi:hypothetical protein
MNNPKIEFAASKVLVAREMLVSAYALLISEGVDK